MKGVLDVPRRWGGWIVPFLPLLALAWPSVRILLWMNRRFFEQESYYSHGWLIPPAVAWLIYLRRSRIAAAARRSSFSGAFLYGLGVLIAAAGFVIEVRFLSAWGLVLAGIGWYWSWEGAVRARIALPPLILLLGMIPLPGVWLLALTARLKALAAAGGVVVAGLVGVKAVLDGSTVIVAGAPPGPNLVIGDPCSGLRSLLVFVSLGLFFALQEESGPSRKVLLVALALVMAPLSNLLRVVFLIVVRRVIGPVALEGPLHLVAGAGAFGFCFLLYLLSVGKWCRR